MVGKKFSLRYDKGPVDISQHNISYREKLDFIQNTLKLDSRKAAIELSIDIMHMQAKGEIVRLTDQDVKRLLKLKEEEKKL